MQTEKRELIDPGSTELTVGVPKVGIFFVVDERLLLDAVQIDHGDPYGDTLGHGSHYEFWDTLAPKNRTERRFKERAYDAYPRGRVVYFTKKKRFVIYLDRCLRRDKLVLIAAEFGITKPNIARDEHYQCAACNPFFME